MSDGLVRQASGIPQERDNDEMMSIDGKPQPVISATKVTDSESTAHQVESRDDDKGASDQSKVDEREEPQGIVIKKKPKKISIAAKHKRNASDRASQVDLQDIQPGQYQQQQGSAAFRPHQGMQGSGRGSYPPHPYGYAPHGGAHDHPYRGSHHHSQYPLPPMSHPGQQTGHFGAQGSPYHPGYTGHSNYGIPPSYHPPHGYPIAYQNAMRMGNFPQPTTSMSEDAGSIGSTKSKGSKSGNSRSSSSSNSRKKRTIDGVDEREHGKAPALTSAFAFRRTTSSASTSSTVTAGNNTSNETPNLTEDSPQKPRNTLPPLSSRPDYHGNSNMFDDSRYAAHQRSFSGTSTASSLSVGGLSISEYGRGTNVDSIMRNDDAPLVRSSPKRRRGPDGGALSNDGETDHKEDNSRENLFLSLSTSPINSDVDATPISKNTKVSDAKATATKTSSDHPTLPPSGSLESMRGSDTPTPPLPESSNESDMITDEHLLNRHLRYQSFTPLPHIAHLGDNRDGNPSPPAISANPSFTTLGGQLSWDITGDTPSVGGDLSEWDDDRYPKLGSAAPTHVLGATPASLWKEGELAPSSYYKNGGYDTMRLSALSPNSDVEMHEDVHTGATTPIPMFFDHHPEERENGHHRPSSLLSGNQGQLSTRQAHFGDSEHIHHLFITNSGRGSDLKQNLKGQMNWNMNQMGQPKNLPQIRLPPTPVFGDQRDDYFGRSPHNGARDAPDFFPSKSMFALHQGQLSQAAANDRVRNLRGRAPPGQQRGPMAHQLHQQFTSSHNLTSPIGIGSNGKGMWTTHPHHGHQMSQTDMNSPKPRKCLPLKPPLPTKFQGDMDKFKTAHVPEFTSLVNFPGNMSQTKATTNLPEGLRCCVMCGQACPCSVGGKQKKAITAAQKKKPGDSGLSARNANNKKVQEAEKQGFAIIPTQNKGLCTLCDVNVWVVVQSGLEIKWCKGCKNFRPWAAFGEKGLATKCLRCRDRQREKYALQKEEKERARIISKSMKNTV